MDGQRNKILAIAVAATFITIIASRQSSGWASRRLRRALHHLRGSEFIIYTAHAVESSRLLDEATTLVTQLLGVAAGDHEESCDGLPCGFLLVHAEPDGEHVVGYVRMASAPGAISVRGLEKMVRMGMVDQARQRAKVAGMSEEAIDAICSMSPSSSSSAAAASDAATTPTKAYMGSLVVAPRFQGLGLGKALARVGAAHAARIGCSEVVGSAATPSLVPFYESLGALAEHRRPRTRRADMPTVKATANSRELRLELGSLTVGDLDILLGSAMPAYVSIA